MRIIHKTETTVELMIDSYVLTVTMINNKLVITSVACYEEKYRPASNAIRHQAYKVAGAMLRTSKQQQENYNYKKYPCSQTYICYQNKSINAEPLCSDYSCRVNN